jgi:protein TonB
MPAPPSASTRILHLISSVPPVYPQFARERSIGGNVVVQFTVEPNGSVGATKVLSGPPPLREAAMYAVRQWKYEPAKTEGESVEIEQTVTLHFGLGK